MLAIARALVTNPRLLLLDEPMEGLAPIVVQELAEVLRGLAADGSIAILLVEQHAELALSMARRAVVMERGRIVHDGPSAQLLADRARLDGWLAVEAR
jgi:branched-chain amino acid transport system ATP-binding protein